MGIGPSTKWGTSAAIICSVVMKKSIGRSTKLLPGGAKELRSSIHMEVRRLPARKLDLSTQWVHNSRRPSPLLLSIAASAQAGAQMQASNWEMEEKASSCALLEH